MQHDPIIDLENASDADVYEKRLISIIRHYGEHYAASVMERYVQKRLMASGHQVTEQEIMDYVKKVAEGLNDANGK
tara:strand:- start:195 stop:422 length:228 start_codon:yes stop_codon:yes gene_type:complete